jgi:hypothetical protein
MKIEDARVGDLIKFEEERNPYTIQARSNRFIVCTKPFAPRKTVLYTIVDLEKKIRGTENLVFGLGQETREQCYETLLRLHGIAPAAYEASEVSYRNRVPLHIQYVKYTRGRRT